MHHEEQFYVVDENDNIVGCATRNEYHKRGLVHRSVYVIVLKIREKFSSRSAR